MLLAEFFTGPKANFTICTEADLSVLSPVKEYWEYVLRANANRESVCRILLL